MSIRDVTLSGAFNIRDLGGLDLGDGSHTLSGVLYRGDALHSLTSEDRRVLFHDRRIRLVVDLRTHEEAEMYPSDRHLPESVTYARYSLIPEGRIGREPFPSTDSCLLAERYLINLTEGQLALERVLETLAQTVDSRASGLYHCAAGRDRTGLLTALILDHLGVPRSVIAQDYSESNRNARQVTARLAQSPLYAADNASATGEVQLRAETIMRFLELMDERYGGVTAWASASATTRNALRSIARALRPAA